MKKIYLRFYWEVFEQLTFPRFPPELWEDLSYFVDHRVEELVTVGKEVS